VFPFELQFLDLAVEFNFALFYEFVLVVLGLLQILAETVGYFSVHFDPFESGIEVTVLYVEV